NTRVGQIMAISGSTIPATSGPAAPVMLYQTITYRFAASSLFPGQIGLFRQVGGGTAEELMAPFASSARFRHYQTGDDTSRTTAVAGMEHVHAPRNEAGFCAHCHSDPTAANVDSEYTTVSLTGGYATVVATRVRAHINDTLPALWFIRSKGVDTSVKLTGATR